MPKDERGLPHEADGYHSVDSSLESLVGVQSKEYSDCESGQLEAVLNKLFPIYFLLNKESPQHLW